MSVVPAGLPIPGSGFGSKAKGLSQAPRNELARTHAEASLPALDLRQDLMLLAACTAIRAAYIQDATSPTRGRGRHLQGGAQVGQTANGELHASPTAARPPQPGPSAASCRLPNRGLLPSLPSPSPNFGFVPGRLSPTCLQVNSRCTTWSNFRLGN